ncbi:uncharacterized protein LOC110390269 [Numida meleagris]|uniref:uncharacterized protein LOC110390269 n=1 Tax=Numida meleagris TaxID=8996 RepID=UPI000B3DAE9E|nr:uncharacterized protein LOC110390269 [Numida meleagris]
MATELDRRCPICLDSMDDASHVMPCLHQFCFGCIRRWIETRPKCPLCKRRVRSILHLVRADDSFEEFVVGRHERARRAPQHQMQAVPIRVPIFCLHPCVLEPLLPWLRRELRQLFGADGRAAFLTHRLVISGLCLFGLDEGALTLRLSSSLQSQATSFVWRLIVQAARLGIGEVQHPLGLGPLHAATGQGGRPAAAPPEQIPHPSPRPSSSTGEGSMVELPVPSTAARREAPGQPPSIPAPVLSVQGAAQEEPGEAVPGPSTASTVRQHSHRAPQRAPKRRAHTSEAATPLPRGHPTSNTRTPPQQLARRGPGLQLGHSQPPGALTLSDGGKQYNYRKVSVLLSMPLSALCMGEV